MACLAGSQGIPPVLYEAASIDGATRWQQFRSLTLPLMRPVALSVLLLGLIYTFKVSPSHLRDDRRRPSRCDDCAAHLHLQADLRLLPFW